MKEKAIVIDVDDDGDSIMDDYGKGLMVNAISENTSLMSEKIDIPIICLDEDDDDDVMVDKDYKVVFDHRCRDDNSLSPSFEIDNGESDTRKFCPCVSKVPKLENENLKKNRVGQQGNKRKAIGFKADVKRSKIRENIQRDNRIAERRKRRIAFSEAEKTSRTVPSIKTHQDIQRDNKVKEVAELKVEASEAFPLLRTQKDCQRDKTVWKVSDLKAGALRAVPLVITQEGSQQDKMISEVRKRQADELKALRAVPLVITQESSERDNTVSEEGQRRSDELKAQALRLRTQDDSQRDKTISEGKKRQADELKPQALRAVPLVTTQDDSQRGNTLSGRRKRQADELNAETLSRAVPVVRTQEGSERDNTFSKGRKKQPDELKAQALRAVPLFGTPENSQRHNTVSEGRKRQANELKAETLSRAVPLVIIEEDARRENGIAEQRKRKLSEATATETSRLAHVERGNRGSEFKDVDETSRNKGVFAGRRNKNEKRSVMVVDKEYMIYLTWLVDSLKDSITEPMKNLENDLSDSDPPILDTYKESTKVPEKDVLVKPKVEQDVEYLSDDSDIIEISDTPFLDGEGTPFVASKKVIDLDEGSKEDESNCSWFRKELRNVLKQPYDEGELKNLRHEVSIHRRMIRCRELRKGRETDYETNELGQSYLENFPDFNEEYKMVDGVDKVKALKLLRGFFFYLKYVSHDGAFKPWGKNQSEMIELLV